MTVATGIGSWPGEEVAPILSRLVELPHTLAYLPELPQRGPAAAMIGRTLGMVSQLGFDLHPSGWRLVHRGGRSQRVAASLLQQDLDVAEELIQGWQGPFKVSLTGPWTLVAQLDQPRGEGLLADAGAVREVLAAHQLASSELVASLQRRFPEAELVVQFDEPLLGQVVRGQVATASRWATHRAVDQLRVSQALEELVHALPHVKVVWHSCAADPPVSLLRGAAAALSVDVNALSAAGLEQVGRHLDAGGVLYAGVIAPDTDSAMVERQAVSRMQRIISILGFSPPEIAAQLVLAPTCGFAGVPLATAQAITQRLDYAAAAFADLEG